MIVIIDYGMGNAAAIQNMLKYIGCHSEITADPERINKADKLVMPGVGAFDAAMHAINDGSLRDVLDKKALVDKIPVLGICLGMQLMTMKSEEGRMEGLGWIQAATWKFSVPAESRLKIPHMGWNEVAINNDKWQLPLQDARFYFVHSYYVKALQSHNVILRTTHGIEFDSMITNNNNIFGVQFHPEKSHKYGIKLFNWFAKL